MKKKRIIKIDLIKKSDPNHIGGLILPAAKCIKDGGLVVFPTETVYGIGANSLDEEAVKTIFEAKSRPSDNPLIVHIANHEMLKGIVEINKINSTEKKLIQLFMPGPFTIILKKKDNIPYAVSAGLDTIGVRIPDNLIALKLIEASGCPICAPSANISGKPSGTSVEDIFDELVGKVDYIIDSGKTDVGIESTVVKVIDNMVHILRPGKISKEEIEKVVGKGNVVYDKKLFEKVESIDRVESPGMKHRHYAPDVECVLVYSKKQDRMLDKIAEICIEKLKGNIKVGIIGFDEDREIILKKTNMGPDIDNVIFLSLGSRGVLEEISRNVFTTLRRIDKLDIQYCIIEGVKSEGIGVGIMNRLIRACEHKYIEI